ncbi:4'-phosphopantetheinyl transferase superfamily protein [Achromobacter sp. LC458]|uniref:4'-phosphopantetheinyl transferase family protein n=1 Tax=Achromobacter sp. LC458 TaxID=1120623 RepID=UPI000AA3E42A|nr:4'-phosphopantetheinyl transferase superfamily protein [Achromobacter sp. LC458]
MYWADKGAAELYRVQDLSENDALLAPARSGPKAREDWRVSRALLHDVRRSTPAGGVTSLSHSGGHAVCARAPDGWAVGADLERLRTRDFAALAAWVCSKEEAVALAALEGPAQCHRFYLLWTLKEALIKAAKLAFPADMATVGLARDGDGTWRLRAPPGPWQAASWMVGDAWMASVVWQGPDPATRYPIWRGGAGCALPALTLVGEWRRDID